MQAALVGRDAERAQIEALLADACQERGGALVLSGEAGIGKSALCGWAIRQAGPMRVVSVRGIDAERDLPFAGVSELCSGELHRVELLPARQALALDAALARRDAAPCDRFAIGAALLSLLGVMGDDEPVLVVVDDAQWLDDASTDALVFAARRLRSERVALLLSTRPGAAFDGDRSGLRRVRLRGLATDDARTLLGVAHGTVHDRVAALLVERTGGNPLALLEVPRVLSEEQLAGVVPIEEPLPVGPSLTRALLQRVSNLPRDAHLALLIAAASGGELVQPVVDALGALGLDRTVLEPAERAGALAVAGERFEFRHPLLRSAVYHGAVGPARRAAHATLAEVTTGEVAAWHCAHATVGEDAAVAQAMEITGMHARRRGAPAAAARALERAARLTQPGATRARRLTEAARDAHVAGRPTGALQLLRDALKEPVDARQRADIHYLRGRVLVQQGKTEAAHTLLVREADRIHDAYPARAATMLAEACINRAVCADVAEALSVARRAWSIAAQADDSVQAFAGVMLATALVLDGQRTDSSEVLDRLLPALRATDPLSEAGELVSCAAQCFFWLERYDVAGELLDRLTTAAREASAPAALLVPLCCRAELDLRRGRWAHATAQLEEADHLGAELSRSVFAAYAPECLARLAAVTGEAEQCRAHVARALRLIDEHGNELGRLHIHAVLGLLELGHGRIEQAIGHLERARELAVGGGISEPNVVHWHADLVEAYVRGGRPAAAREALIELERGARRTGGSWALGTSARCRGLLAGDGDSDACFAEALAELEMAGTPFEVARTHLCHGERLRRAGRRVDARRALRLALDGFERLGAEPWTRRTQMELRASGATLASRQDESHRDRLTPHELQVALIVAHGASNKDAAAALFLSTKTIEFHLTRIYRKLGIRTRTELAGVAARRGWLDRPAPMH